MRRALAGISARGVRDRFVPTPENARGLSIPAPVEGWDAITPIAQMPQTRAVALDNMFPQPGYVEIRKGHKSHCLTTGASPVETLMAYHGLDPNDDKLFAAAGAAIYDVTTSATATVSSAAVSGLANSRFQGLNVSTSGGNFLWICNGADVPRIYDGSAWATASITGITPSAVISAAVFKEKIWMVRDGEMSPAYLETDSLEGTATVFDLVGVFSKGGYLQSIGTWSLDGGNGPDDNIAFITSRGEAAIYSGIDPSSDFTLIGVYEMGAPIGRRCLTKVGSDLAVICIDGVVPLSRALLTDRAAALSISLTKLIQPVVNQSARDWGSNFGWQLIGYPRGTRAILNVPVTENGEQWQYVMNTVTGAWCRFKGEDANCWAVFQDRLFYGGNNGEVMEADCQGFDTGSSIDFNVESAFNYCGSRGRLKQFDMCRALLTTDGKVMPGLAINVDFSRNATVETLAASDTGAAQWDVDVWDGGIWPEASHIQTDWLSIAGQGYCASVKMSGSVDADSTPDESLSVTLQIAGWDMLVKDGAFL